MERYGSVVARAARPLPAPLPPETRTVGQLVAETIRLYGRRFWPSLALGVGPALVLVASVELGRRPIVAALTGAGAVIQTSSYIGACRVAAGLTGLVLSPMLFLGGALLYFDQAARVRSGSPRTRRPDAALPDALDPDRSGP